MFAVIKADSQFLGVFEYIIELMITLLAVDNTSVRQAHIIMTEEYYQFGYSLALYSSSSLFSLTDNSSWVTNALIRFCLKYLVA